MIPQNVATNWKMLLQLNDSQMPFEFVDIFSTLTEPYLHNKILLPSERRNILLELEESLTIECDITDECNSDNIKNFCHKIAFDILEKCKTSPEHILTTLTHLKTQN